MPIDQYLPALAKADPDTRRAALLEALQAEGLSPQQQTAEPDEKLPCPPVNFLLLPDSEKPCPLFCAHYDAVNGSTGANDNAAAVCILIALARTLREKKIPAAFAFLDGEETGHTGVKLFEAERSREFTVAVNLDMCGYGDTVAVYCKGGKQKSSAVPFLEKKRLAAHGAVNVKTLPEGDDKFLHSRRQPVFSIAVMPKWDIRYLDALAAMGSGLLGHSPEYNLILGEMEVSTTMHRAFRDDLRYVQPTAMQQVYDYLLDAVTAAPSPAKRFGFF